MASFNRVILAGNLTRDVELRQVGSGTSVADLGLAVNERRNNASGEWTEEATFVDVTAWGRVAETASEYLRKGDGVLIEGRLKLESWEANGQKRSKLKVVADRVEFLGGKRGGMPRAEPAAAAELGHVPKQAAETAPGEDIPF